MMIGLLGVGGEFLKIGVSPYDPRLQIRNAITLADSRAARCDFGQVVQRSLDIEGSSRKWHAVMRADMIGLVASEPRMVSLGFGKFARSDRIFALEPLLGEERGDGHRTRVWVEGIKDPIIAARTEVTILRDMGQEAAATEGPLIDEALDLASRLAAAAEAGRVDLNDLGRRARRLLAATTGGG
jgi:hypothetical protein